MTTATRPAAKLDILLKSILDYSLAGIAIIICSPLLLTLALIVHFDSPGSVVYRRKVMGVGGKQFDAFKFRTMRIDGEVILVAHPELLAELQRNHKLKQDPRITRSGRWMRKASLDELLQLINVLRGEMSFVGPRIISPPELTLYGEHAAELLTVKPGITGLWQVSGRSDLMREDRVRLDMQYVRSHTTWLDIRLLVLTIPVLLRARGAY